MLYTLFHRSNAAATNVLLISACKHLQRLFKSGIYSRAVSILSPNLLNSCNNGDKPETTILARLRRHQERTKQMEQWRQARNDSLRSK